MTARRVDTNRDLDPVAEAVREELMKVVARRTNAVPGAEVRRRMPRLDHGETHKIRNGKIYGWDRLFTAAIRFDIDVAAIWAKHQKQAGAA